MAMETILVSTAMLLLLVYILKGFRGRQNQGNWGSIPRVSPCLPYFGNALQLNMAKCHLCLSELRQKYGPVFCIRLFKEEILVLNDSTSIREALILKGSDYAGRPPMYRTSHAERNKHSIVWQTYTQKLVFLRKSVTKSLRMYGSGLQNLEGHCEPDIRQMCERLAGTEGQAFDPWNIIYDSVCSIMLYLTLGTRLDYSSCSFQCIKKMNVLFNDTFGSGRARRLDFVPLLRLFHDDCYCRMQEALKLRDEFWEEQLTKLKERNVHGDCVVWNLLHAVYNNNSSTSTSPPADSAAVSSALSSSAAPCEDGDTHKQQSDVSITTVKEVFTNLILAGTDTTATALTCLLLILLHHPQVQSRLQQEVDQVVGKDRSASLADRPRLPYVEAVLMELLRYISHVPLAVPHYTTCETSILNKPVPANTTVS